MATIAKSIRKIAAGFFVAALAVGFSAFTSTPTKTQSGVEFYNTTGIPSTNPNDYIYDPSGRCGDTDKACSASWDHSGPLTPGVTHPDGAKLSPDEEGTYLPNM